MHGDAHLNNTLLRRDVPEVAAFVDWEMCTIGDPLLDLGWILCAGRTTPTRSTPGANWPHSVVCPAAPNWWRPTPTPAAGLSDTWTGMWRWPASSSRS
jgi:aminoglycoside phosphotransferase (APT) family kinase protein